MSFLVKLHNKAINTTYVYESESYWDKERKQPRSRRKLIGKIDPATGEIVPTGKRGSHASKDTDSGSAQAYDFEGLYRQSRRKVEFQAQIIKKQREKIRRLSRTNRALQSIFRTIKNAFVSAESLAEELEKNDG